MKPTSFWRNNWLIFIFISFVITSSAEGQDSPTSDAGAGKPTEVAVDAERAETLIRQLGAATFAEREQAVAEVLQIGMPMVPYLRKAVEAENDAETVLRARATLMQLTTGNLEAQVASFLSGRSDGTAFQGWQTFAATLGDSLATRDMFVQIMRVHPDLLESLDGTTRERTVAVERASQRIQMNMFQNQIFPTQADAVALLLPIADPGVTISMGYEATLMSVLQKQMGAMRRDTGMWSPLSRLLNQWVSRSRGEHRNDVLWYAMQWDLSGAATLGVRTLSETADVETLQTAMQAISRFGIKEDAKALEKFVEDPRPAVTRMPVMVGDEVLDVTLGDTALATIAVLYRVPLQDLGMKQGELHPKIGFLVDNAGYLPSQKAERARAVVTVREWIQGKEPTKPVRPIN